MYRPKKCETYTFGKTILQFCSGTLLFIHLFQIVTSKMGKHN